MVVILTLFLLINMLASVLGVPTLSTHNLFHTFSSLLAVGSPCQSVDRQNDNQQCPPTTMGHGVRPFDDPNSTISKIQTVKDKLT